MIGILVLIFWVVVIFLVYLQYTYKHSKNKHLIFKTGVFRPLSYTIGILAISPLIVNFLLPDVFLALDTSNPVPLNTEMLNALREDGNWTQYYAETFEAVIQNFNYAGILIAGLILFAWLVYIKKLDFFDQDKPVFIILTLLAGMIMAFATLIVSDQIRTAFNIQYRGNPLYDLFIHFSLGVGVIEELMKLLPFFVIWALTKQIKEPYDFILYACTSALGFAFIENLIYFQSIDAQMVTGRALMAAVGHMMFSTFCIYGIIISRYKFRKSTWVPFFILYFLIGSFAHGLYDYMVTESMTLLLLTFFAFGLQAWAIMINNSINNSRFFNYKVYFNAEKSKFLLATLLSFILALGYIVDAFKYGKSEANLIFLVSCFTGIIFIIFYTTGFSSLDLVKGYWRPIKFRFKPDFDEVPGFRSAKALGGIFKYNFILPLNIVNYKIWLKPPYYNEWLYDQMYDTQGTIIDRVKLYDNDNDEDKVDVDWFVVKLDSPLNFENINNKFVLIKLENKENSLIHDADVRAYLRLIPSLDLLKVKRAKKKNFEYAGYILIDAYEYPEFKAVKLTRQKIKKRIPAKA